MEREVKAILVTSNIPMLGEELAWQGDKQAERFWVVDPVDGAINYSRQLPLSGISLPLLCERYLAGRSKVAALNGQPLRVSGVSQLNNAIVGLGDFAVGTGREEKNRIRFTLMQMLAPHVLRISIRMLGSAAGRLDISIILSNKVWDVQAGVLLARETGAVVFDGDGSEHTTASRYTLAAVPMLKKTLLGCVTGL